MKNISIDKLLRALLVGVTFYLGACKKMDATYRAYIEDGEIVYVSKVDSIKAYPGRNRIKLSWPHGVDPKVSQAVIFWNSGQDSIKHAITRGLGVDTIVVWLNDMPEGTYLFDVFTYDQKGNSSIRVSTEAKAYGDDYEEVLQNRKIRTAVVKDFNVVIDWYSSFTDAVAVEVTYTDQEDQIRIVHTAATESLTILENYKAGSAIRYRTTYKPEGLAVDTFYAAYESIVAENKLDKSKFKRWNIEAFPYTEYNAGTGYNIEKLWDEVYTGYGYIYLETQPLPRSFTFDLGQKAVIERIRLSPNWEQQLYQNGNIKRAQIWGSDSPNVTADFSTWTYLGNITSVKPSNLPLGQTTSSDLAYAKAGEYFAITPNLPPVRYIRFVVEETWSGSISMHITELTFWGNVLR